MRTKNVGAVVAGLVIGLVVLGGCSSKVTPEDLKKRYTTQDSMSQEQADCIVDGFVAKGVPLEHVESPNADEQNKIAQVMIDCANKVVTPGVPPPAS